MQPSFEHRSPAFEKFLGGLWNKVKALVKGAVNLAKKGTAAVGKVISLGWLFDKLKQLIKPLLRRVLPGTLGAGEPESIQRELDARAASLLFSRD